MFHELRRGHFLRRHHRQACLLEQTDATITFLLADPAQAHGHFQGHHGTRCHGLAVQPDTIAHVGFDGVAEGMAEVEGGAHA
ncbi:hypothetical protein D9M73_270850 [compost metagenome]